MHNRIEKYLAEVGDHAPPPPPPCLVVNFYSIGVTHVELKRDNSIFRVAGSVTFDPVREDGEAG